MSQQDVFDYVMNTPHNTNPAILKQKLKAISAQADWAETDENSPAFIKNRTHYTEVTEESIEGREYANIPVKDIVTQHNLNIPLQIGQIWDSAGDKGMGYNGLEVQQADDGTIYIGDYPNCSSVPFYITANEIECDPMWIRMIGVSSVSIVCVSGTVTETTVRKLDTKYLPDGGVGYSEVVEESINIAGLEYNIQFEHNGSGLLVTEHNLNIPFALGQVWSCTLGSRTHEMIVQQAEDGTLYINTANDGTQYPDPATYYITTNTAAIAPSYGSAFGTSAVLTGVSGTITVATETVHQLDPKYLPERNVIVTTSTDAEGNLISSHLPSEIYEAVNAGSLAVLYAQTKWFNLVTCVRSRTIFVSAWSGPLGGMTFYMADIDRAGKCHINEITVAKIPKAAAIADITEAPTAEDFNALLAALRAAGHMET